MKGPDLYAWVIGLDVREKLHVPALMVKPLSVCVHT